MRKPIVAGNWKMNTSYQEALDLAGALMPRLAEYHVVERVLIPPFPWIVPLANLTGETDILLGAQNCGVEDQGAFTGEVSARMLAPFCAYIIVGHSERRHLLGESNDVVAAKLRAVLRNGARPILCVGETLDERDLGRARAVVEHQLRAALGGLPAAEIEQAVIAYEPVWAIGTGRAATAADARDMAVWIREVLTDLADHLVAERVRIQYGGSVTPQNAAGFIALPEIDGALVGGASLNAEQFVVIVESAAAIPL